ncbi:MAG: hypothetical protein PF508_13415 [Spirochaeta sp.]|jgi:hypothetical protein|nr:hypothetical protein [Spirochaeta sp.]
MKRIVVTVLLAMLVLASLPAQIEDVLAQTSSIEFVNNTGYDIFHVFFSPGDSDYWGPDVLDATTVLGNGEAVSFLVHHPQGCNTFDIMAVDEDYDAYYRWDVEVCDDRDNRITLTLKDYAEENVSNIELIEAAFVNDTPYDMWLVFLSPSDSSYFGVDVLGGSTVIGQGDGTAMYIPVGSEEVLYDVISFDEDGDRYVFQIGIDNSEPAMTWPIEMTDLQ